MKNRNGDFVVFDECPACKSQDIRPYKKRTIPELKLDEDRIKITDSQYGKIWDLSLCGTCGHIFANPCPSPDYIFGLYSKVKDPLYEEEAEGRAKNFVRILSFLEKILPAQGPLFDVGAATGILLDKARARGWIPDGIEPSAWAVEVARKKYGLRIQEGFFETADLGDNRYAAATMIDFIEHTPLPFAALQKAWDILKPSGVLSLVTPDIASKAARISGRTWWHFRPAHLAYFSRASLEAILRRAGFRIIAEKKYSWTFSARYLLSRHKVFDPFLENDSFSSFLGKIPIKLALGDSFEVYARKERKG